MKRTLYIVRGLPGSGKSTLAAKIAAQKQCQHIEVDMFMTDANGNYSFRKDKLKAAHRWCKRTAAKALQKHGTVVVSNTSATLRTLLPYFMIAYRYKALIIIREPNTLWQWDVVECAKRNKHSVRLDIIEDYKARWFPIKPAAYSYRDMWHGELLVKQQKQIILARD